MKYIRLPYFPGVLLFLLSVLIGLYVAPDYGVSWDEPAQRDIGYANYYYVFEGKRAVLDSFVNKDYGASFELFLVCMEKVMGLSDFREIYLMRHIVCHLYFLGGCLAMYLLAYRIFRNRWIASLAFLLLLLMPRFYAHSFFNSKDILYVSTYIVSLLAIQVAFEKRTIKWFVIAGLCCGYTTSIRVLGALFPAVVGLLMGVELLFNFYKKQPVAALVKQFVTFIASYIAGTIIFWPYLWTSPVANFIEGYQRMAHFRWQGSVLFKGNFVNALELPSSYLPVWFSYTVPVLWLLLGAIGVLWLLVQCVRRPVFYFVDSVRRNFIIYLATFFAPVALVIALHSVIYDDWRHLYFIYSAVIMFILFVISQLAKTKLRIPVIALCLGQLGMVGYFMINNHPFQQVYFNELMSREENYLRYGFEMDYWGASSKQALEYVLTHDTLATIKISSQDNYPPIGYNINFLPPDQRKRVVLVSENDSTFDYFITFFRFHPYDYDGHTPVKDFRIHNNTFLRVSKRAVQ